MTPTHVPEYTPRPPSSTTVGEPLPRQSMAWVRPSISTSRYVGAGVAAGVTLGAGVEDVPPHARTTTVMHAAARNARSPDTRASLSSSGDQPRRRPGPAPDDAYR